MNKAQIIQGFTLVSQLCIPIFILLVIWYGVAKKVRVYDSFVSGAKDGAGVILNIFPYLVAILFAVKTFQASGAFEMIKNALVPILSFVGMPVETVSICIIKPLSGSAATGVFTDIVKTTGPDSLASRTAAVIMGSAETTFYVLAVYLGSVRIRKTGYLVPVCVFADLVGIAIAVVCVRWLF